MKAKWSMLATAYNLRTPRLTHAVHPHIAQVFVVGNEILARSPTAGNLKSAFVKIAPSWFHMKQLRLFHDKNDCARVHVRQVQPRCAETPAR